MIPAILAAVGRVAAVAGRGAAGAAAKMGASEVTASRVGSMAEKGVTNAASNMLSKKPSSSASSTPSYESRTEQFNTGSGMFDSYMP